MTSRAWWAFARLHDVAIWRRVKSSPSTKQVKESVPEFAEDNDCAPECASRTRSRPSMLEAKTPASAWKPSRADGEEEAADPAAVDDDVGASMVKGRASGEAREMPTSTPLPVPGSADDSARKSDAPRVSPPGARETAWWGEDLAARLAARGDPEAAMRDARDASFSGVGAHDRQNKEEHQLAPPFSAARTSRGRIAGDGAVRCFACGGEYTRNEMVLLSRCGHPLCAECAEALAEKRGARCATCKKIFDGWHFGVRAKNKDGSFAAWRAAFRALKPELTEDADANDAVNAQNKKRKPARSARALAFDGVASAPDGASNAARSGGSGKRRKPTTFTPGSTHSPNVSPSLEPSLEPELNDADEDELLAAMREAGGASFQTPAAGKSSARTSR